MVQNSIVACSWGETYIWHLPLFFLLKTRKTSHSCISFRRHIKYNNYEISSVGSIAWSWMRWCTKLNIFVYFEILTAVFSCISFRLGCDDFYVANCFWRLESIVVFFKRRELFAQPQASHPTRLYSSDINKHKCVPLPKHDTLKACGDVDATSYMVSAMILFVAALSNRQFVKRSTDMSHSLHLWWSFRPTDGYWPYSQHLFAWIQARAHVQRTVRVCCRIVVQIQSPVLSPKVSQSLLSFEIGSSVSICCHIGNNDHKQLGTSV
jgi:hypothetical protein